MALIIGCKLQVSDYLTMADILSTIFVGLWIGVIIQRNFTTIRALKEYFITENNDIRKEYDFFFNKLFESQISASKVQEWFKFMTIKIDIFESFLNRELIMNCEILTIHNSIKYCITGTEEINTQFSAETLNLSAHTKSQLLGIHKNISYSLTKSVIEINAAKNRRKSWFRRIFKRKSKD